MSQPGENNIKGVGPEEDMSSDTLELLDLPEPILLHIFSFFDHDYLRHVASKVSVEFKRLAHSQVLWSQASLTIYSHECWDKSPVEEFVRNILVTPYLHHLTVALKNCEEDISSAVLSALVSTHCRLHKLSLTVDDYGPETMLFLQQHPELKELELSDNATDDDYAAGVAATVRRLAPRLISLNLSLSGLLHMPKTGQLLASVRHELNHELSPADTAIYLPAGSEPLEPQYALDLRNVDDVDCEILKQDRPQGLLHLEFIPYGIPLHIEPSSMWATTAQNVSQLLHAHKKSLKRAKVSLPSENVCMALAECTELEDLSVVCDPDGSGFCAMLQTMQSSLRHLHLEVPTPLGAQGLATVLQTLCRRAPRLETLALSSWRPIQEASTETSKRLFPGFRPLQGLLVDREGLASLREVHISHMGPVGREQFLELASMATANAANAKLSLRKLHLADCACSVDRSWAECRDRAEDALRAAVPSLEYTADCILGFDDRYDIGFMPMYSCDCEKRRPNHMVRGRASRAPHLHRGGRGRGHP